MTTEQLYELMEEGNLGYACVYKIGDREMHTDIMFPMIAENIANFIGKYAYEAEKIILTDLCDRLICETIYGGLIMDCPNQNLCREIISNLAPIQLGDAEPKEFMVTTREEMEVLWDAEEAMQAELRML